MVLVRHDACDPDVSVCALLCMSAICYGRTWSGYDRCLGLQSESLIWSKRYLSLTEFGRSQLDRTVVLFKFPPSHFPFLWLVIGEGLDAFTLYLMFIVFPG